MSFKVSTQYKTNASGRSQVIAKAQGKQATHNFDASKSSDWNHGTAAGALLLKLGYSDKLLTISHESSNDGVQHSFKVTDELANV